MRSWRWQEWISAEPVFFRLAVGLVFGLFTSGFVLSAGAGVPVALHSTEPPLFSADLPVFFDQDGTRLDLAVSVRHPQLHFKASPSGVYAARALLSIKLARQGEVGLQTRQVFVVEAPDEAASRDPGRFALLELSRHIPPGLWAATVEVEDLEGRVGVGHRRSRAQGILTVPRPPSAGSYLSDLEFRWSGPQGVELPAPERLYGVHQDTLLVYFELNRAEAESVAVAVRVEDPSFGYSQGDTLWIKGTGERRAATYRAPLGSFPEGTYRLSLMPLRPGALSRTGDFSVSWSMENVAGLDRDPTLEVRLLFEGEERERLLALPRSAQLDALDAFWRKNDPTPGTQANELYDLFQERVKHAERFFAEQGTVGPLSARGRVYIRFGPPQQIQVEVIPNDPEDLEEAIVKVHDPTQVDRAGWAAKSTIPLNSGRVEARQDLQRLTPGRSITEAAFELWIYDGAGDPLFPRNSVGWSEGVDLRFLFVDSLGTGVYRLETSNDPFRRDG